MLQCGLMDWGCVSQMNVAMAIWGAMSGAETDMWDDHFDELLDLFCAEFHASGGPGAGSRGTGASGSLYAVLMGITWLLDVPALIPREGSRQRSGDARTDPPIKDDESVRAPLQMLTNVLNIGSQGISVMRWMRSRSRNPAHPTCGHCEKLTRKSQ